MQQNVGLLLEGGGMRCAYTAGVLDLLLDKNIHIPIVSTASASALIGSSYVSRQRDRNYLILKDLGTNPESVSFRKMLKDRELFGVGYIFDQIPRKIVPLDFTAFSQSPSTLIIATTEINTGKPIYFEQYRSKEELLAITRASCSLPVFAPIVHYNGLELMDGGISDPIPIKPLLEKGITKHIVVLTRSKGYIKRKLRLNWFFKRVFKNKPKLVKLLRERHNYYNETMKLLLEMEKNNEVFFIQPEKPLMLSRFGKNSKRLYDSYVQGYREAEKKLPELEKFLKSKSYKKIS